MLVDNSFFENIKSSLFFNQAKQYFQDYLHLEVHFFTILCLNPKSDSSFMNVKIIKVVGFLTLTFCLVLAIICSQFSVLMICDFYFW